METRKFVYYQEDEMFIGWFEEFPDYRTQGASLDELKEYLEGILECPVDLVTKNALKRQLKDRILEEVIMI